MIYTTYMANMKNLPAEMKKFLIVRKLVIPEFKLSMLKNTEWLINLSPTESLLTEYKTSGDWEAFKDSLANQIRNDGKAINELQVLLDHIKAGRDICLVCYEKDYTKCHRSLIAKWLAPLCDNAIEWTEWKK